jgi:type IV secretory pathway protease TraF
MKTILIILALLFCGGVQAQTQQAATKIEVKQSKDPHVGWYQVGEFNYPVYQGSKGGLYIIRVSKKSGEEYRQYIAEEKKSKVIKE